mgnify:FL=1
MTLEACAGLVERGDPDRFLAAMAAPPKARAVLMALYAVNIEVARAPWASQEPLIARMRLQWWRDALAALEAGKPVQGGEAAMALAGLSHVDLTPLQGIIDAREWDIEPGDFSSESEFSDHIDATAGNLMWAAAKALGASPDLEPALRDIAFASGIARWLQAVPALKAAGLRPLVDESSSALQRLAQDSLTKLRSRRGTDLGIAIHAAREAWRAPAILKLAAEEPERALSGRLHTSEFRRRGSLLARVWLGRW